MAIDLYEPVLEATRDVFQLMLDLSDISDRKADDPQEYDAGIAVSVGVTGDLTGRVIYCFPQDTSFNIVKIMCGMEMEEIDEFVASAMSEIANIISGNVLTILAGESVQCDLQPPEVYDNSDNQDYKIRTTCCLTTDAGELCLDVRLNPSK
jgi:chemotaxis protein CheX